MTGNKGVIFICLWLACFFAHAQDVSTSKKVKITQGYHESTDKWSIEIPVWIPGFRGDFAYGEVGIEGDDSVFPTPEHPIEEPKFGSVFKRLFTTRFGLNYFYMGGISYQNKQLFAEIDLFSGSIGSNLVYRASNSNLVKARVHTDLVRAYGGYKLIQHPFSQTVGEFDLYAYGGIRLHNFFVKTKVNYVGVNFNIHPEWIEPVLGVRNEFRFNRWKFVIQGDLGSFWINDKYSYMINLHSYYKLSDLVSIKLGWNSWHVYYRDTILGERLRLITHLAGPVAAVSFEF